MEGEQGTMRGLMALDTVQLRRVESAIARIEGRSSVERAKMACLLAALQAERAELLRYGPRSRRSATPRVAAA